MIKANIGFYSLITEITKFSKINMELEEKSNVHDLLVSLVKKFGEDFEEMIFSNDPDKLNSRIIVLVNEINISDEKGLNTLINSGDRIVFLPAIAGG